jgi:hypothetical protein
MANLEALWIAGELAPGATVLASSQAHYTHGRVSAVLKLPYEALPCDRLGRMDVAALEQRLKAGGIGTVVATLGTTAVGAVDPLPAIPRSERATASACTPTAHTAAITCSPATSRPRRARRSIASARPIRS